MPAYPPNPTGPPSLSNSAYGTVFSISAASPVSYLPVVEVASITKRNFSVTAIDVTHLQSPNATEELVPGMLKPGTIELMGNYIGDASQQQFIALAQNQTVFYFQIQAPMQKRAKTLTATGTCFMQDYETGPFEPNRKIDFKVTVQITGSINEVVA